MAMNETGDDSTTADVYAGDMAASDLTSEAAPNAYMYAIEADAEPNVLALVANVLNLANTVPLSASLQRKSIERVQIAVEMERIGATTADMIRRKLMQLTCVFAVELVERVTAAPDHDCCNVHMAENSLSRGNRNG